MRCQPGEFGANGKREFPLKTAETYSYAVLTPMMRKLSSLSILVRLNFDFPEFCMSFVSLPAKITMP